MPRPRALLLACLLLALAGCGGDEPDPPADAPEDTGGEQVTGCEQAPRPSPKQVKLDRPTARLNASRTYVATVTTSCGAFEITLDAERAPRTGASFKALADRKFYDGLSFHRVSPGFVVQGGDPAGNGSGGPGYSIREAPPDSLTYDRGVVAMAKTEIEPAGTSGSQFFVVTAESTPLTPEYALVGTVTKGLDVVEKIGVVPVDDQEQPVEPVVIERIVVVESR